MRLLADECCPAPIVAALRNAGHDVTHMLETNPGAPDTAVVEIAMAEGRVVVSEDYDFGELTIRHRLPIPGLVLLALGRQPMALRISRTLDVIGQLGEGLRAQLTVVEPQSHRTRALPQQ